MLIIYFKHFRRVPTFLVKHNSFQRRTKYLNNEFLISVFFFVLTLYMIFLGSFKPFSTIIEMKKKITSFTRKTRNKFF